MANKYEDIITIKEGRPAYNIQYEGERDWESFIPNAQFNTVLRTVLKSVKTNNIDDHKSFWINGTFGTGKSHAAAVVTHLLCDEVDNITEWLRENFKDANQFLRDDVLAFRQGTPDGSVKGRRLLPVKLMALESIAHPQDLSLVLQKSVKKALDAIGLKPTVKTDFESYASHVENQNIWDIILQDDAKLSSIVDGKRTILAKKLRECDNNTFARVQDALRNSKLDIRIDINDLAQWMAEVEQELVTDGRYDGLLIVWDEFTDVMKSPNGVQILKAMQPTVEKFGNINSNSYFLLISHPSAFDPIKEGTAESSNNQINGRFHIIHYNMEAISAFHIMSHKLKVLDDEKHTQLCNDFYAKHPDLEVAYTADSNDKETSKDDLHKLFPLHPGTAYLASYYATTVGSSSRSVFGFLGSNDALRDFLASKNAFMRRDVVTADFLWDFVEEEFRNDHAKYSPITERYNTFIAKVNEVDNPAYAAVFKAILLLNAFNNVSGNDNKGLIAPSEKNIKDLFVGTLFETEVDTVLDWLHNNAIIQRDPNNFFLVQFAALPANEVEQNKNIQKEVNYKTIAQVIKYAGEEANKKAETTFCGKIVRQSAFAFFADSNNPSSLRNEIKNNRKKTPDNTVFFALLMAKNNYELNTLRNFIEGCIGPDCNETELKSVIFVLFHEVMTDAKYNSFIEYLANSSCAQSHGFNDQTTKYASNAKDIVIKWITGAFNQQVTLYFHGVDAITTHASNIASLVNSSILPTKIYTSGPEACSLLRQGTPDTFWNKTNPKKLVQDILSSETKSTFEEKCTGAAVPLKKLFQDCLDENMKLRSDVKSDHPVKKVCDKVSKIIEAADKSTTFNLADKFDALRKPPFGLWTSYASMAMMAVALKPYVSKIFDMQGKARKEGGLGEDISELFKVWDDNKSSSKLNLKFQTLEETNLTKELAKILHLQNGKDGDTKSLDDVRFAIVHDLIDQKIKIPLWSLKYASADKMAALGLPEINDDLRKLIDNIFTLCRSSEKPDNSFLRETLRLVEKYRLDFSPIVINRDAYDDGYKNFLLNLPVPKKIDADQVEEVIDYINRNMEGTIGMWDEERVLSQAKDWIITKLDDPKPDVPVVDEPLPEVSESDPVDPPVVVVRPVEKPKREKAKARIAGINSLDEAKLLLQRIADMAGDNILDTINM